MVIVFAITVAAWILLFGYLFSTGSQKSRWLAGAFGHRAILLWSWICTASAVCVLFAGWGFFTWRLSTGVMLVPTAPQILDGIVFGYVLLAAAVLALAGWLPRGLLPAQNGSTQKPGPVEPLEAVDDPHYQPLYPGLSFGQPHQRISSADPAQEPPDDREPSVEIEERPRPRRRLRMAAAVVVLTVGIIGALGMFIESSTPAGYDRFALAGIAANVKVFFNDRFTNGSGDIIRDDATNFQTGGKEFRAGDFAFDVDQWRPLAEQGHTGAQYKLGVMYANGRGVSRDYVEAYKWLNIAGAQNNEKAIEGRDAVARRMTPAQIEIAQNLSRAELSLISAGNPFSGVVPARITEMTQRELVGEAQKSLNARGYEVGVVDGIAGRRTQTAVRQFERQSGLPETGRITAEFVARLEARGQANAPVASKLGTGRVSNPTLAPTSVPRTLPVLAASKIREAPATECDNLAAHPSNSALSSGVDFARIDPARAIPACEQAVANYPDELRFKYQLARSLHKAERYGEALALYSETGEQGFALAQRSIGFMYANANGVAQDLAKAVTWLRRAADRCDADAQFALGTLYANGQGMKQSETESLRWLRIAAAQNHPDARARLNELAKSGATLSARDNRNNFEAGDFTEARYAQQLLTHLDDDDVDAFLRQDYAAVLASLRPQADQGAASAQTVLGYMYSAGLGVDQNDSIAVEWYRKAAEQDDPDAQYLLGYMHHRGFGVAMYFAQALQWYRKSAAQGVAAARVGLGEMYDKGQGVAPDRDAALAHYSSAAEAGLAAGQHNLAVAYENGDGVPRDFDAALKWYRLAAAQDFAPSQNSLGEIYSQGRGMLRDHDEAAKWYRLAAEQGLPAAQFKLAKIVGDTSTALELYKLAAEQGHPEGQVNLGLAYLKGGGVDRSQNDALDWFQRAAAQCNVDAQFQLAKMHRRGQGGAKASAAEELKWLKLAAEQGHTEALQMLSARYAAGEGVEQNMSMALKSAQRAAEQGHPTAQFDLAEAYAKGSDAIPQDFTKAAGWYRKAAVQSNRTAQFKLAELYREGRGVARSNVEAVAWYRLAAEQGDRAAQYSLATAYRLGAGVERDDGEAANWYLQAALQGEASAQRDLGLQYLRGEGVLQDFVQARLWLGRAAAGGDVQAQKSLDRLASKITPSQISEAERLAKETPGSDG